MAVRGTSANADVMMTINMNSNRCASSMIVSTVLACNYFFLVLTHWRISWYSNTNNHNSIKKIPTTITQSHLQDSTKPLRHFRREKKISNPSILTHRDQIVLFYFIFEYASQPTAPPFPQIRPPAPVVHRLVWQARRVLRARQPTHKLGRMVSVVSHIDGRYTSYDCYKSWEDYHAKYCFSHLQHLKRNRAEYTQVRGGVEGVRGRCAQEFLQYLGRDRVRVSIHQD